MTRNILLNSLIFGMILLATGRTGFAAQNSTTLDSYEAAKKELSSMTADFVQKKIFTLFEETDKSEGKVLFKKPDQVLWRYESPSPSETFLVGEDSWSVIPATKQVQKIHVAGGNASRIFQILGLGKSEERLDKSFEIKEIPAAEDEKGYKLLSLVPKVDSLKPYYSEIIVKLSIQDFLPRQVTLKEQSGDITEIILNNLETNEPVEDSVFEFKVPEGYQLIDYND